MRCSNLPAPAMRARLAFAILLWSSTAGAQFCPGVPPWTFNDVPASDPFCSTITWLAQTGVTLGCQVIDANNRLYCPADGVRRDQMAAFMSRLGNALFPSTCAAGQVMKWNGLAWTCADDALGGGGGGGTVTSVLAGTGLTASPNPITGAGSINLAASYRLPQSCAANQVTKWIGGAWTCANDADTNAGGTVTSLTQGSGITLAPNPIVGTGTISADTAYLQRRVLQSCSVGSGIRAIAADGSVTCETDDAGPANALVQGGNAFNAAVNLGTTDNWPVRIVANGNRVMRYEPNAISPNLIGGHPSNAVTAGLRGATIAGGGVAAVDSDPDFDDEAPNEVTDHYGTVGGGYANRAGNDAGTSADNAFATVGGGRENTAAALYSVVGGGRNNSAAGQGSTVAGGWSNDASGEYSSTVGGGKSNVASGSYSTVSGGSQGTASGVGSAIGGGGVAATPQGGGIYGHNWASGSASTVPGGLSNVASGDFSLAVGFGSEAGGHYSVAMGRHAKAMGNGSFSFADSNDFDFSANSVNAFRVRATGGVRFVTDIDGTGAVTWSCLAVAGAGWACASDRNLKHSLVELDARAVLDKVAALPVYQWQPKGQNAHVLHYGPMAQDFHAAFGLGDDDKMIGMQDADGVALAAIKGLNDKLEAQSRGQQAMIAAQQEELFSQREQLTELRRVLAVLMARTGALELQANGK